MSSPLLLVLGRVFSCVATDGFKQLRWSGDDFVDETVPLRFFCRHEVISFGVLGYPLQGLAGTLGHDLIESLTDFQDFSVVNVDLSGLSLKPTHGLMNHHPRIRQGESLAFCSGCE